MMHTPTEWLRDGRTVYALNSAGFNRMTVSVMPALSNNGSTPEEQEANARLIAASPMLLEALKDAQSTIDAMLAVIGDKCEPWSGDHQKDWHGFCDSFDRIGEAIEKAEGKEGA